MELRLHRLMATEILSKLKTGHVTVENYVESIFKRIDARDAIVEAWAYLDRDLVLEQAKALDALPPSQRGPLHGLPVAVKDVLYTKDMPTQLGSKIYKGYAPKFDAGCVTLLREAGALILGKTITSEFAVKDVTGNTRNPHDPRRTPGGTSSGSAAAVADFQAPLALGTQTGGSIIRPASYTGIYGFKPTWDSITRQGVQTNSLIADTVGFLARSPRDLNLIADAWKLSDDYNESKPKAFEVKGAKFAVMKTIAWPHIGADSAAALDKGVSLLRAHGATVEEVELPSHLDSLLIWDGKVLSADMGTSFQPIYAAHKDQLSKTIRDLVENKQEITRRQYLDAYDGIAAARPEVDKLMERYAAVLTPSVTGEAPVGHSDTGSPIFCSIWTVLHTPVVNVPGFAGSHGMPIGLSLVAARYRDRHLLAIAEKVGEIFEAEGGWKSSL